MSKPSEYAIGIAARLWCEPEHSRKEMDADFAMSIAVAIDKERQNSFLEGRDAAIANGAMTAYDFLNWRGLPDYAHELHRRINAVVKK